MRSRQFWVSWLLVGCPAPTPRAPAAARQGPTDISLCSLAGALVVGGVLGAGCLGLCALLRGGARWDGWRWQCPCQHSLCCREIGAGWQAGGGEGSVCRFTLGREEQARATAAEEALHLRPAKGQFWNDTQQGSRQSLVEGVCAVIMNQGRLQEVSQAAESPKLVNAPAARSYMCVRVKAAPAGWPGWGRVGRQQKQLNFPSDCGNQNFSPQCSYCCKKNAALGHRHGRDREFHDAMAGHEEAAGSAPCRATEPCFACIRDFFEQGLRGLQCRPLAYLHS